MLTRGSLATMAVVAIYAAPAVAYYMEQATTAGVQVCSDQTPDAPDGATLTCGNFIAGDTSNGAQLSTHGLSSCGSSATAPGLLYRFEDASFTSGTVTFSTCDVADYDNKLHIFDASGTCLVGRDDTCGLQVEVSAPAPPAGSFLQVFVSGFLSSTGTFCLNVFCNA